MVAFIDGDLLTSNNNTYDLLASSCNLTDSAQNWGSFESILILDIDI